MIINKKLIYGILITVILFTGIYLVSIIFQEKEVPKEEKKEPEKVPSAHELAEKRKS